MTEDTAEIPAEKADEKQKAILKSAFQAFTNYGFRRTSMDDIARGAGMSRPALYLHYRNKEDIYRSLSQYYYDDTAQMVQEALAGDGDPAAQLQRAFESQAGEIMRTMLDSPHGDELLDTGHLTSADIAMAGEARIAAIYAEWMDRETAAGRLNAARFGGDTLAFARAMLRALKGLKMGRKDFDSYRAEVIQLSQVYASALAV